jgi:hypothetical protein
MGKFPPGPPGREGKVGHGLGTHLGAGARAGRRQVPAVDHLDRVDEMLVKVVHELDPAAFSAAAEGDVVKHGQVLDYLAQPDAPRMRADGHTEFGRQQEDGQVFVDARNATGVNLAHADRITGQHLLENDPVGHMLPCRHQYWCDGPGNRGVAQNVVGAGRFLDPVQAKRGKAPYVGDRFSHVPHLVRVYRQLDVRPHQVPHQFEPAGVVFDVSSHLQLEVGEALGKGRTHEVEHLLVRISEPAG